MPNLKGGLNQIAVPPQKSKQTNKQTCFSFPFFALLDTKSILITFLDGYKNK